MTVKQLRAFVIVAQTLSFVQACERLYMSQAALSLSIKALEEGLGGRLFSRTTRSVSLTPEGLALLPMARRLIAEWDNTEDEMRQRFTLRRGRVALAAMPPFAGNRLPVLLKHFRERYPTISVTVHDVINEQVIEMVRNRQVELGIETLYTGRIYKPTRSLPYKGHRWYACYLRSICGERIINLRSRWKATNW